MAGMDLSNVYAVVLAGGQSSRLFPFNKILTDLTGSGKTLLQQARARLKFIPRKQIYVLTNSEMVKPVQRQLKLPPHQILTDPARRGTWPAILWAMAHIRQQNPEAVIAVITGDHVIGRASEFHRAFRQGVQIAQARAAFVVIPVLPSNRPEDWLGFGTLKAQWGRVIEAFEEKPSLDRARQMIGEGGWAWNAGMFFFRIKIAEEVLKTLQPAMSQIYSEMVDDLAHGWTREASRVFELFPGRIPHPLDSERTVGNTIDYAIMTPLTSGASEDETAWVTRSMLTRWTDLGQWTALRQVVKPDKKGNVRLGDVRSESSVKNCILAADRHHEIMARGIDGFIVAFAEGGALVLPESEVRRVRELVKAARAAKDTALVTYGAERLSIRIERKRSRGRPAARLWIGPKETL
jgi:mannose-1-phosphate guanylyltransferase